MPENAVACSGDIVSLSPQVDNPNNEIDHVEWVSSGTQISGDVSNYPATENVNGCEPLVVDYTFSILFIGRSVSNKPLGLGLETPP